MKFILKTEHLALAEYLNFQTTVVTDSTDIFRPVIDIKRPFGNSSILLDVCEILGYSRDEKTGGYSEEDMDRAEMLLIELPVALHVILKNRTFELGEYEVDEHTALYYNYRHMCVYHTLKKPVEEIGQRYDTKLLVDLCMNLNPDGNIWDEIIEDLSWFQNEEFRKDAKKIFEKFKPKN